MSGLATSAPSISTQCNYNGFIFPAGTLTKSIRITPVKDDAQRTIIYSLFSITLEFYVGGFGRSTDREVNAAITALNTPGAGLRYRGRGCGDIVVNVNGPKDVLWGPFTDTLTLEPRGSDRAVKIQWTVTFALPTCNDGQTAPGSPMEFQYATTVNIDNLGNSTRTYHGFIKIANNRITPRDRRIIRSADEWREKINPPLLEGFRRVPGTFELSADKSTLHFSVQDIQFPNRNIYPRGILHATFRHGYSNTGSGQLFTWVGSLDATYTCSQTTTAVDWAAAYSHFAAAARDRIASLSAFNLGAAGALIAGGGRAVVGGAAGGGGGGGAAIAGHAILPFIGLAGIGASLALMHGPSGGTLGVPTNVFAVIPMSFSVVEEDVYGPPTVSFSMKYRVAGLSLAQILASGGLHREMPDSNWFGWATSIGNTLGPRGTATNLVWTPGEDSIVDLCARVPVRGPEVTKNKEPGAPKPRRPAFVPANLPSVFPTPSKPKSWIDYTQNIRTSVDSGTLAGVTLPSSSLVRASRPSAVWDALSPDMPTGDDRSANPEVRDVGSAGGSAARGEVFVQQRVKPVVYYTLTGYAFRAGYPIPQPFIDNVNGAKVVPCNREGSEFFEEMVVANMGIPVYAARWNLRFVQVDEGSRSVARPLPVPDNPVTS